MCAAEEGDAHIVFKEIDLLDDSGGRDKKRFRRFIETAGRCYGEKCFELGIVEHADIFFPPSSEIQ